MVKFVKSGDGTTKFYSVMDGIKFGDEAKRITHKTM